MCSKAWNLFLLSRIELFQLQCEMHIFQTNRPLLNGIYTPAQPVYLPGAITWRNWPELAPNLNYSKHILAYVCFTILSPLVQCRIDEDIAITRVWWIVTSIRPINNIKLRRLRKLKWEINNTKIDNSVIPHFLRFRAAGEIIRENLGVPERDDVVNNNSSKHLFPTSDSHRFNKKYLGCFEVFCSTDVSWRVAR